MGAMVDTQQLSASLLLACVTLAGGCKCRQEAAVASNDEILAVRVTMPDNGDKPLLSLEVTILPPPDGTPCHYAIYEFSGPPRLSKTDIEAVSIGSASEESEFEGVLHVAGELTDQEVVEYLGLADPFVDQNPVDKTIVSVVCPELNTNNYAVSFDAWTTCAMGIDTVLQDGPTLEPVEVEILE